MGNFTPAPHLQKDEIVQTNKGRTYVIFENYDMRVGCCRDITISVYLQEVADERKKDDVVRHFFTLRKGVYTYQFSHDFWERDFRCGYEKRRTIKEHEGEIVINGIPECHPIMTSNSSDDLHDVPLDDGLDNETA